MNKQIGKKWMACGLLLPLLAGCGAGSQGNGDGATEGTSAPVTNTEPVELVFFYTSDADWNEETFMKAFGEPIHQKYPHITVKFLNPKMGGDTFPNMVAAGQQFDVIVASTGLTSRLTDVGLETDISPLISQNRTDMNVFDPQTIELGRTIAKGGLYGLPVYTVPAAMYYNKDIFDKFGVPYPKDGMTWDQVYEHSRRLAQVDSGVAYRPLGVSIQHFSMLNQYSLGLIDAGTGRANYANPQWNDFINNIVRFYQFPGIGLERKELGLQPQRDGFFKHMNTAMWLALTNLHTTPELGSHFEWDLATFPSVSGKPGVGPQPYPTYFYISQTSKHKEQAFKAIAHLASPEVQRTQAVKGELLPVLKDPSLRTVFGQESELYKGKNVKALLPQSYAPSLQWSKYDSTARVQMEQRIFDVILGGMDVNTALRTAQEATNKAIDTAEGK